MKMKAMTWIGIGLLGLALQAQADDQDAIALGPQPWHSVAVYGTYQRWRGDQLNNTTGQMNGDFSGSSSTVSVSGSYAVRPNVNVLLGLSDQTQYHEQDTWQGTTTRFDSNGTGSYVGISARPMGHSADPGFGLFGVVQTGNSGHGQWFAGSLGPQYRFTPDWLLTGNIARQHSSNNDLNSSTLGLNLLWRPAQRYSLQLSVSRSFYSAYDTYSPFQRTAFALTGNYHLSRSTSVWTALSKFGDTDRTTSYYDNNFVNERSLVLTVGVRYRFGQFE